MKNIVKLFYGYYVSLLSSVFGRNKKIEDNILIFSYPRSGSTWLLEILTSNDELCAIFEPFNPYQLKSLKKFSEKHKIFFSKDADIRRFKKIVIKIFKGKLINRWMISHSSISKLLKSKQLVIKILRVNYVLEWFLDEFKENKKIFLVRHPGAVVSSTMRASRKEKFVKNDLNQRSMMCNGEDISDLLINIDQEYQRILINWCIENKKIYKLKNSCIMVFYEDLKLNSNLIVERIYKELEINKPSNIDEIVKKPSLTTNKDSSLSHSNPIERWRSDFEDKEIESMQKILDYFKIDFYKMSDSKPLK